MPQLKPDYIIRLIIASLMLLSSLLFPLHPTPVLAQGSGITNCEVYDFSTGDKQGWDIIVNYGAWTGHSFEATYLSPPTDKYLVHIRKTFPAGTVVTGLKWYWNNAGSKWVYAEKDNWTADLVSLPDDAQSVTVVNNLNETININLAMAAQFTPAGTELTKVEVCFPINQPTNCEVYDFSTGDKQGWDIIVNYGAWTGHSFEATYLSPPTDKYLVHIRKTFPAGTVVTGLKWYWNNAGSKWVYAEKDDWVYNLVSLPGDAQSVTVVNNLNETININLAMAAQFTPAGTELTKVEVCFPAKLVFLPYLVIKPAPKAAVPPAGVMNSSVLPSTRSIPSPATTTTR